MSKFLDGIVNAIFGPDPSAMSEKDRADTERQRASDRREAAGQAYAAMNDQGESYIDGRQAVSAGNSKNGLLESIGSLFKLFAPGGGGGA